MNNLNAFLAKKRLLVLLSDQGLVSGGNFLFFLFLARSLPLDDFGQFSFLWLIVLFVQNIRYSLSTSQTLNLHHEFEDNEDQFLSSTIFNDILIGFIVAIPVFLSFIFIQSFTTAICISITIIVVPLQDHLRRIIVIQEKYLILLLVSGLRYYIPIAFLIFFNDISINSIFLVVIISSIISWFFLSKWFVNALPTARKRMYFFKKIWFSSKWLTLSAVFQWLSGNFYILMVGIFLPIYEVGFIKSAQSLMGVSHIFLKGFENFYPKRLRVSLKENTDKVFNKIVLKEGLKLFFIVAFLGIFGSIYSDELMVLVYGTKYEQTGSYFSWYLVSYAINFFIFPLQLSFMIREKTKPIFYTYIISAIASFILCYPLLKAFGGVGAVIGIAIVNCINLLFYIYNLFLKRK